MDVLAMFVLPAIAGVAIGILSGLLGIGGGTVMVPIFRLAFGMSPVVSTATSLFAIIPTSISGAASHIRHKTCIVSLGVAAGLGGALTSPLGVWLAQISPAWMIMVAAALIIGWSAVKMLGKAFKMRSQNRTQQHAALIGIEMRQASGTSLIAVMILAIPGVVEQALLGNINYAAGIAIAVGSIPGAVIGARLVRVVPELALRFVFGFFLIVAAVILVLNEFGILG